MVIAGAVIILIGVFLFVLGIRTKDLPEPDPVPPMKHLEERRARIYEGLRDLQFEYRVGKLSEDDYQRTKLGLQKELAVVMAQLDQVEVAPAAAPAPAAGPDGHQCPHCQAVFDQVLKFCGECGKPMAGGAA
jgi:hypothetical protein